MLKQNPIKRSFRAKLHLAILLAALLAVAALSVGTLSVARAATITVDSITNVVADDGFCTLREAITAANTDMASGAAAGECPAGNGADTIELDVGLTYTLDVVDNSTVGDNGLPSITSVITINGNGSTIERDELAPEFRIFNVESAAFLILNDVTITGGVASGFFGGGIQNLGTVTLTNSTISGNSASSAGGIYSDSVDPGLFQTTLDITNSTISGNSATGIGGGIYNNFSTLTVTNSSISGNTASSGGGINNTNGAVTITNSAISGNSAAGNGGGISNVDFITLTNSTVSGNSATGDGGGIWNVDTIIVINSTFSGNSATGDGGIFNATGTVNLTNAIIANSPSGGDCSGLITSLGHNLDSDNTCSLTDSDDLPGVDPLLGPLQNNGGTTDTLALRRGSTAIDAADNVAAPATDQRGIARPHGPDSDIGAYEFNLCTLVLDVSYSAGIATLEATVGTLVPATENIWGTTQSNVINLESTAIPVTDPPVSTLVFSGAVPAQGVVAVFATLTTTEDGIICSDFKILDTGSAP